MCNGSVIKIEKYTKSYYASRILKSKRIHGMNKSKKWCDEECREYMQQMKLARIEMLTNPYQDKLMMFRARRIAFKRICRKRKKKRFIDANIEKMEHFFSNNKTKQFVREVRNSARFKVKTIFVEDEEGNLLAVT